MQNIFLENLGGSMTPIGAREIYWDVYEICSTFEIPAHDLIG
jgi:hypothetical protein